jgi:hypothetical protein
LIFAETGERKKKKYEKNEYKSNVSFSLFSFHNIFFFQNEFAAALT